MDPCSEILQCHESFSMAGRNDKLGVQHVRQLAGKEEAEVDAGEAPEQVDGVPGGGVGAK